MHGFGKCHKSSYHHHNNTVVIIILSSLWSDYVTLPVFACNQYRVADRICTEIWLILAQIIIRPSNSHAYMQSGVGGVGGGGWGEFHAKATD